MTAHLSPLADQLETTLGAAHPPVPLVTGSCGSGRTAALLSLRDRLGARQCQYVDVERVATTPERLLHALISHSPFLLNGQIGPEHPPGSAREAFDAVLVFLNGAATSDGAPATFLLDEVLEFRTFESFPGLRSAMADLLAAIGHSRNRFVLSTRFTCRARKLLREPTARVQLLAAPPLSPEDVLCILAGEGEDPPLATPQVAQAVHALTGGRIGYVQAVVRAMSGLAGSGGADPISALSALLAPGGRLNVCCRFSYELRLHRARGYGALKAILDVLAEEEPLTLTAVAQRIQRTPGSTKDYLSWLEDVDLVHVCEKKYRFGDPLVRLWARLYGRPCPPEEDDLAREVHRFAMERLAPPVPRVGEAPVAAPPPVARGRSWGIIEFD
jgi:hypothetical protein